mgnify:CR=1 FL=1
MLGGVAELLTSSPYVGYTYSYPHKTTHRPLEPPRPLRQVWSTEDRDSLFLYVHVPYCEMRCGFCNLFTTTGVDETAVGEYLDALARQAAVVDEQLGPATIARMAIGGGTPTLLTPAQLEVLLCSVVSRFGAHPSRVPTSVETSPQTATPERLAVLASSGVERVSIGVQSFDDVEVHALGRPQRETDVEAALRTIRDASIPILNIDLMYGGQGQTPASFCDSIRRALAWSPEELYLYPLYVRKLTGLARRARQWDDERLHAYRVGRDLLLAHGYRQVSMRMFRRGELGVAEPTGYRCQDDGMVGLGCGARSYTRALHYSWPYSVGRPSIRQTIDAYVRRADDAYALADYGVVLSEDDQRRRFVLLSLLQTIGLDLQEYRARFGASALAHMPPLQELLDVGLAVEVDGFVRLTDVGLERSDAIGPWLYSSEVRAQMDGFAWM